MDRVVAVVLGVTPIVPLVPYRNCEIEATRYPILVQLGPSSAPLTEPSSRIRLGVLPRVRMKCRLLVQAERSTRHVRQGEANVYVPWSCNVGVRGARKLSSRCKISRKATKDVRTLGRTGRTGSTYSVASWHSPESPSRPRECKLLRTEQFKVAKLVGRGREEMDVCVSHVCNLDLGYMSSCVLTHRTCCNGPTLGPTVLSNFE